VLTLERALLAKDQHSWPQYCLMTTEKLNSYGYVAAAIRFNKVVAFARNQNPADQDVTTESPTKLAELEVYGGMHAC
jgi:hypothetical protein